MELKASCFDLIKLVFASAVASSSLFSLHAGRNIRLILDGGRRVTRVDVGASDTGDRER